MSKRFCESFAIHLMCGRGNECQDFWKSFISLFSVCNVEFTDACRTGSVEEAENLKAALSLDEVKKIVNQHSSQESLFFRYLTSFFFLTEQVDAICLENSCEWELLSRKLEIINGQMLYFSQKDPYLCYI